LKHSVVIIWRKTDPSLDSTQNIFLRLLLGYYHILKDSSFGGRKGPANKVNVEESGRRDLVLAFLELINVPVAPQELAREEARVWGREP
jgi:hypothetical protein